MKTEESVKGVIHAVRGIMCQAAAILLILIVAIYFAAFGYLGILLNRFGNAFRKK